MRHKGGNRTPGKHNNPGTHRACSVKPAGPVKFYKRQGFKEDMMLMRFA